MPKITAQQIETKLERVAAKAILDHPKVKLIARVNHQDNFALFYARTAYCAMMDVICVQIEGKQKDAWTGWFNAACSSQPRGTSQSGFDLLARQIASRVYAKVEFSRLKTA